MVKKQAKMRKQVKVVNVNVKRKIKKKPVKGPAKAATGVFGPVSTIDTAPISIGNTVTGSQPVTIPLEDGMRVQGRDFLIKLDNTAAAIVDWTLVGGSPVVPACMVASTLKHFSTTYAHYMIHGVAFHFITSATTATDGSVMFYINKDRAGPGLPTDSANFMPAVLSDHNTLIGPIWNNCTAKYLPEPRWLPTDVLNSDDLYEQSCGELMVFTKTSSNIVPGYVLVDYDITFRGMSLNPKAQVLPVSRMKYTQALLRLESVAVVSGTTLVELEDAGTSLDAVTPIAAPTGAVNGDIYKIVMNLNDAFFLNGTAATVFQRKYPTGLTAVEPLTDGFTCYGVVTVGGPIKLLMFPSYAAALANSNPYVWGVTATLTARIPAYISLVGQFGGLSAQSSI